MTPRMCSARRSLGPDGRVRLGELETVETVAERLVGAADSCNGRPPRRDCNRVTDNSPRRWDAMQIRTMKHAAIAAALAAAAGAALAGSAQAATSPTLSPATSIGDGRLAITPIPIPGTQLPPGGGTGPVSG